MSTTYKKTEDKTLSETGLDSEEEDMTALAARLADVEIPIKTYITGIAEARSYYSLKDMDFLCPCGQRYSWKKEKRLEMLDTVDLFRFIERGQPVDRGVFDKIINEFSRLLRREGDIEVDYPTDDMEKSMAERDRYMKLETALEQELKMCEEIRVAFEAYTAPLKQLDNSFKPPPCGRVNCCQYANYGGQYASYCSSQRCCSSGMRHTCSRTMSSVSRSPEILLPSFTELDCNAIAKAQGLMKELKLVSFTGAGHTHTTQ